MVWVAGVESVMGRVALAGLSNPRGGCGLFAERVMGVTGTSGAGELQDLTLVLPPLYGC